MSSRKFTHFNKEGRAKMVDVTEKDDTVREAVACGKVVLNPHTLKLIKEHGLKKGDVLGVAQTAGIMAAKKTGWLIPMCHPLFLTGVDISFNLLDEGIIEIKSRVKTTGKTGVEMEALTAVSAAALTIYDMCKAVDKEMEIQDIYLLEKTGGRSGHYFRKKGNRIIDG
ncbi:MAG: cyclic pyranopterin monophosphate synthase MoaC [Firmicutes bacterium HGW-Firmicutes-13]|nr:MAG: cyclic pyranopterin monophosphate synthase MoaC [Firmicutes bacterium HGW-Firmicutes-13]